MAAAAAAIGASTRRRGNSHGPAPRGEATSATLVSCPFELATTVRRGLILVKVARQVSYSTPVNTPSRSATNVISRSGAVSARA